MKLLHFISSLEVGGAQRLLSDLLPILKGNGYDVSVLTFNVVENALTKKLEDTGIHIMNIEVKSIYNPFVTYKLIRYFNQFDIIHVHLFPSLYWAALASIFCSGPTYIYTEHSTSNKRREKRIFKHIESFVYNRYKKIISISEQTESALTKWLSVSKNDSRFCIINNGIDIDLFSNVHINDCDFSYPYTMIMISRFVPAKDQKTVIKAMSLLDDNIHMIFVGDGETINDCKQYTLELNISDRVHFLGTRSDIPQLIAQCDIGIQSSHWEGFGLTAVEMMAGGLPVIASNVEGLRQVVENAGLLFETGNATELKNCVNKLISDKDYYNQISVACKERSSKYSITKMAEEYIYLYTSVH